MFMQRSNFATLVTECLTLFERRQNALLNHEWMACQQATGIASNDQRRFLSTPSFDSESEEDDYDSLQYQYASYGGKGLRLFRKCLTLLNNDEHLEYLLYHWVIGDTVLIRYINLTADPDLIRALASVFRVSLYDELSRWIALVSYFYLMDVVISSK
jgi:hypothetical protein